VGWRLLIAALYVETDGVYYGLARTHRLRMLGNAVVPAQARLALELLDG